MGFLHDVQSCEVWLSFDAAKKPNPELTMERPMDKNDRYLCLELAVKAGAGEKAVAVAKDMLAFLGAEDALNAPECVTVDKVSAPADYPNEEIHGAEPSEAEPEVDGVTFRADETCRLEPGQVVFVDEHNQAELEKVKEDMVAFGTGSFMQKGFEIKRVPVDAIKVEPDPAIDESEY